MDHGLSSPPSPDGPASRRVFRISGGLADGGAAELAASLSGSRPGDHALRIGITTAPGSGLPTDQWADAVAGSLADQGLATLLIELSGRTDRPGISELAAGAISWRQAVTIDDHRRLARVGPGAGGTRSAATVLEVLEKAANDIEAVVMGLPPIDHFATVALSGRLDRFVALVTSEESLDGDWYDSMRRAATRAIPVLVPATSLAPPAAEEKFPSVFVGPRQAVTPDPPEEPAGGPSDERVVPPRRVQPVTRPEDIWTRPEEQSDRFGPGGRPSEPAAQDLWHPEELEATDVG